MAGNESNVKFVALVFPSQLSQFFFYTKYLLSHHLHVHVHVPLRCTSQSGPVFTSICVLVLHVPNQKKCFCVCALMF